MPSSCCTAIQATIPPIPTPGQLQPLSDDFLQWFRARGISAATLQRNRVAMETRYSPALRQTVPHIAFPFFHCGDVVNVKYRALPKHFVQLKGGQQVFYGLDDIKVSRNVRWKLGGVGCCFGTIGSWRVQLCCL